MSPYRKRQLPVSNLAAPTGEGFASTAQIVNTDAAATATGLVIDPNATNVPAPTISLVTTTTPLTTTQTTPTPTPTVSADATAGASTPISMNTVIGACVGAFIGAAGLILLAIFFYRRYSRSLKRKAVRHGTPRSMLDKSRQGRVEGSERNSKPGSWDKLDNNDMEDKWDGMPTANGGAPVTREVKEMDTLSPGLFKKPPSTVSHQSTEESPSSAAFQMSHPYSTGVSPRVPEARDLLGREPNVLGQIDSGPPMSWSSDSNGSFLSRGGAMSPSLTMAIPTPPAVKSQLHRWESAEVINAVDGGQTAEVEYGRESLHNPFFNAASDYPIHKRSRSSSSSRSRTSRSRSSSNATVRKSTGGNSASQDRVVSMDPFSDPLPRPHFLHHMPSKSSSSSASNDRAIRQLVAAASLDDLSEDEVASRLRVASMQPSIISHSGDSMYTDADPDEQEGHAMMHGFPEPPSSSGHNTHSTHYS